MVPVAVLEEFEHLLLWDEVGRAQTRDPQHLEQKQVTSNLLFFVGFTSHNEVPGEDGEGMNDKASVEDVARRNELDAVNGVIMLGVRVTREEVLNDLKKEKDLRPLQHESDHLSTCVSKCNYVQVKEHVRHNDDGDQNVKECHEAAVGIQDITVYRIKKVRRSLVGQDTYQRFFFV